MTGVQTCALPILEDDVMTLGSLNQVMYLANQLLTRYKNLYQMLNANYSEIECVEIYQENILKEKINA